MSQYRLSHLFNKKAIGLTAVLAFGSLSGCATIGQTPLPLTEGEKKLTHDIFADEVDTSIVRKYLNDKDEKCSHAVNYGSRDIVFYKKLHSDDYSNKAEPYKLGTFVHEMTHVWQSQNWNILKQLFKKCSTYKYSISPDSRFEDYCNEQQASIVGDYSKYYLTTVPVYPTWISTSDLHEGAEHLKELVERTFPNVKEERMKVNKLHPHLENIRLRIESYLQRPAYRPEPKKLCP